MQDMDVFNSTERCVPIGMHRSVELNFISKNQVGSRFSIQKLQRCNLRRVRSYELE
jgi:hypothetical protein